MVFSLSQEALSQSYRLESYDIVDSTNNLAAEFAKSGDNGRLWIVAGEQTGGRGRRGRVWQSPKGNLYASLLLVEDFEPEQVATLGFVAGLALIEALMAVLPARLQKEHGIYLKWPNDVLAGKAKLAGILPEFIAVKSPDAHSRLKNAAIIGIGVNIGAGLAVKNPADKTDKAEISEGENTVKAENYIPPYPVMNLRILGADSTPQELFQALSRFWIVNYALWDKGQGMAALRDKWLRHAAYKGEIIHLKRKGQRLDGIFETIDEKGRLVLVQENGEKLHISAGDVYFGAVASAHAQD